jgi:hypothetical protein
MLHSRTIVAMVPLLICTVTPRDEAQQPFPQQPPIPHQPTSPQPIAQRPIWSRAASILDMSCGPTVAKLLSPDRRLTADVRCDLHSATDAGYLLRLHAGKKQIAELPVPEGTYELVWSPDSHSFFVNGEESSDSGFFVKAYTIDDQDAVHERNVILSAQRDMVESFPPCKAAHHSDDCKRIESDPEFNMSGLGWTPDSKTIFVFAQIPCSSSYGGIMCQARGYEIDAASGQILQRLSAEQVKRNWQALAAWNISVPDPPVYDLATTH